MRMNLAVDSLEHGFPGRQLQPNHQGIFPLIVMLFQIVVLNAVPSWAAGIAIDGTPTSGEAMNAGDITLNHTAGSNASLALACVTERDTNSTMGAGPSATYAGNNMILVPGATQTQASRIKTSILYYPSPPSGSSTVEFTKSTNSNRSIATVFTLTGTATSSIFNTAGMNGADSGTNVDVNSLASAVGEFAVLCGAMVTNTPTMSPDATSPVSIELVEVDHTDSTGITHFVYTEDGAATSIDMLVDGSSSTYWSASAVSIRPAASFRGNRRAIALP